MLYKKRCLFREPAKPTDVIRVQSVQFLNVKPGEKVQVTLFLYTL
jgi:hypothetical protein